MFRVYYCACLNKYICKHKRIYEYLLVLLFIIIVLSSSYSLSLLMDDDDDDVEIIKICWHPSHARHNRRVENVSS